MSSNIIIDRLDGFINAIGGVGYSKEEVDQGLKYVNALKNNPPFYAKIKVSVKNNEPSVELQSAEIGKVNLPVDNATASDFLIKITKQVFSHVPGFSAQDFTISQGKASFKGTIPENLEVQTVK